MGPEVKTEKSSSVQWLDDTVIMANNRQPMIFYTCLALSVLFMEILRT